MTIKYLNWDSTFFKKKIGEIEITNSNFQFPKMDYDLLYVKQKKKFEFELSDYNELYNETQLTFFKTIENSTSPPDKKIFSALRDKDFEIEQIYNLAFESGRNSRFKHDKKFTEKEFCELYKCWVDNSLNKKLAEDLLIYRVQDEIWGFITYNLMGLHASIGLIAVSPHKRGKGLGFKLLEAVEEKIRYKGIKKLFVKTQEHNNQSCAFYKKNGFGIFEKQIIKHFWKI